MMNVIDRIALELSKELDCLLDKHLAKLNARSRRELEEFLWDNKVGILRVLQDRAKAVNGETAAK